MAKYCGKDFLPQRGNSDGPPETFTTIGYMRSTGMSLNKEQVDVTTKTDAPWRQLLEGCGIHSMSISLAGCMTDDAAMVAMIADKLAGTHRNYRIISGHGDIFQGPFEIASLERNGEYNGDEQVSLTLESAGAIAYTPAP